MAYDNETYLRSLAGARSSIDRQVNNTAAEVGRQQQVALDQTSRISPAVGAVTEQANDQAHGVADRIGQTLQKFRLSHPDLGVYQGVDQMRQDFGGRLQGIQDAWGRAQGLIGQGFQEQGDQRRGMVDQIGSQLFADNDLQRLAYIGQREGEDRQRAFAQEQTSRSEALAREQMAAQAAEAERNRQWQLEQARAGQLHQGLLMNPFLGLMMGQGTRPEQEFRVPKTTSKVR